MVVQLHEGGSADGVHILSVEYDVISGAQADKGGVEVRPVCVSERQMVSTFDKILFVFVSSPHRCVCFHSLPTSTLFTLL